MSRSNPLVASVAMGVLAVIMGFGGVTEIVDRDRLDHYGTVADATVVHVRHSRNSTHVAVFVATPLNREITVGGWDGEPAVGSQVRIRYVPGHEDIAEQDRPLSLRDRYLGQLVVGLGVAAGAAGVLTVVRADWHAPVPAPAPKSPQPAPPTPLTRAEIRSYLSVLRRQRERGELTEAEYRERADQLDPDRGHQS